MAFGKRLGIDVELNFMDEAIYYHSTFDEWEKLLHSSCTKKEVKIPNTFDELENQWINKQEYDLFYKFLFPIMQLVTATPIGFDLVRVMPMSEPSLSLGSLFYYDNHINVLTEEGPKIIQTYE